MDMTVQISVSLRNKYTKGGTYYNTHLFLCECKLAFLEKNTQSSFGEITKDLFKANYSITILFYRGYSIKGP